MAQVKISELGAVTTLTDNDVLPIVNSNDTKKVTIAQLKTKITENITNLQFSIVQSLPTTGIQSNIIYLLPKTTTGTDDVYYEYIYINNAWEKLGETQIDLSSKLDVSKVKTTTSSTSGDVYDVTYINTTLGDINSLLGGI